MTHSYTRETTLGRRLRQLGLTALLAGGTALGAHAQTLNYLVTGATNVSTTYTDLGTTGTAITTANTDDANSAAQPIGFTFSYNNVSFTQFTLNTNGFIKLGATAPSDTKLFLSETDNTQIDVFESPNDPNIIAPLNMDLTAGTSTPEYRVATTGTAGSRICTIQWKNVADKAATNPTQYANLSFQVRLYEATGVIELVYNSATAGTTSALRFSQVGIKGTTFAAGQLVQVVKQSTAAWSTATFADYSTVLASQALNTLNVRSVAGPDAGRTFRFTPVPPNPNDAAVSIVYTYGKLATPTALPHAVQAVITNAGSATLTNVVATLNVTGANTFTDTKTVASLAVGASSTVTFASYPATLAVGTNTVTVTVPADNVNTNNSATYSQQVTTSRTSYINPAAALNATGVGVGQAGGALAAKYTLPAATTLSDVALTFAASTGNVSTYQVVVYDATGTGGTPGTILFTSATQARTAAAGTVTVPLGTGAGLQVPASFYIGIKELDTNPALAYQVEDPLKPATYYYSLTGTGSWVSVNNTTLRTRLAIELGTLVAACDAPTAVAVSNVTATGATITFTPPASGTASYQIIYGPTGFNPVSGGTTVTTSTSPYTLTGLSSSTPFQVYVRSNCTAGGTSILAGPVAFTTACPANNVVTTFPYTETFDNIVAGQSLPCGITILDANADGTTWRVSTENPYSGTTDIRYQGLIVNNVAANDWFFTPALSLTPPNSTTRYAVAFRYRAAGTGSTGTSNYTESLEVKSGTTATPAGQTNLLYTNAGINNLAYGLANNTSTPAVAYLPAGTSTQFVGFHVNSIANQGNLYIDDISVTAVTVTATSSEALLRAVTVYPNPSTTGVFNLAINGANAKGALDVQVTNTLGQHVYTGSARDNYTNTLDLSSLAPGLYHLQVKNGDETLTRQISIAK